jgi:hypothetical protein
MGIMINMLKIGSQTRRKDASPETWEIWEDNIKMDLRERGWEVVGWMCLDEDRVQLWSVVNTVMKLPVS